MGTGFLGRAITICLLVFLLFPGDVVGRSTPSRGTAGADTHLVLIVMDGFRPDYLNLAPMRHLHMLMSSGMSFSNAWVGQLETQTPTGHATLATGVYPRKHGVMGFVWRDPNGAIDWMPSNRVALNAGDMERLIEAGGAPSISELVHTAYPGSLAASVSGEKLYAADAMGVGADYIVWGDSYGKNHGWIVPTPIGSHVPPAVTHFRSLKVRWDANPNGQDPYSTRMALQFLRTVRPRVLLVNLPSTDIQGHRIGGIANPQEMRQTVRGVDTSIGQIMDAYKKAGIYDRTLFVVTADHGMVPNAVIADRRSMYDAVHATGAASPEQDYLSTAGYIYLQDPRETQPVAAQLAARTFRGVDGVLYKVQDGSSYSCKAEPATEKRLGPDLTRAYVDLCDTFASASSPDIVLPYAEDTLGYTLKGYGPNWASHGGLSWRAQHIPLIISGPGIQHGTSTFPAKLVDVAPTVERLMGLTIPQAVDGVVLADALHAPTAHDRSSQQYVAAGRMRDVLALERHSAQQHGRVIPHQ